MSHPGESADVDLQFDPVGDHVDLGAGVHHGGGHGGMGAGVGLAGQTQFRQVVAEGVDLAGVEERLGEVGRIPEALDEPAPDLVHLGLGAVLVDAPDDLRRLDQRVVGAEGLGGVTGNSLHGQDAPEDALLAHDHREPGAAIGADRRESAGLGDHVIAVYCVGVMLAQPLGSMDPDCLLVGHRHVGEVAGGAEPIFGQVAETGGHAGGEVQHVDGAPAPDLAVDQLAAEGVVPPILPVGRDHIGVAQQGE